MESPLYLAIDLGSNHEQDVLHAPMSYHRKQFDRIAIPSALREEEKVQPYIAEEFPTPPTSSLGVLACLPPEVLLLIFRDADVLACFRFRQVNRLARRVVSGLFEYGAVSRRALNALRSILRTNMGHYLSLTDVYRLLCTEDCFLCGAVGNFLSLPRAKRCCYGCLDGQCNPRVITRKDQDTV